jgi:hypothetical protein
MAIRVETREYEWSHGHTPRTLQGQAGAWAFHLDETATIVWIRGTYRQALAEAKKHARYSVKVLPCPPPRGAQRSPAIPRRRDAMHASIFSTLCDIVDDLQHYVRALNAGPTRDHLEDLVQRLDVVIDRTVGVVEMHTTSGE